jgi:hypothetical protein
MVLDEAVPAMRFSSSPDLHYDIHTKIINFCGIVRPDRKGMHRDFGNKLK